MSTPTAKQKIEELRAKMATLAPERSTGGSMITADVEKVIKVVGDTVGINRPFELRELTEAQRMKMLTDLGGTVPEGAGNHKVGQMIAQVLRKAKGSPAKYKNQNVYLINNPAPEGTNGPSRWAVMVDD